MEGGDEGSGDGSFTFDAGEVAARGKLSLATRDTKPRRARIDPRASPLISNLQKFSKSYSKLLEKEFSSFSKKTRIASHFSKQLEMLYETYAWH